MYRQYLSVKSCDAVYVVVFVVVVSGAQAWITPRLCYSLVSMARMAMMIYRCIFEEEDLEREANPVSASGPTCSTASSLHRLHALGLHIDVRFPHIFSNYCVYD